MWIELKAVVYLEPPYITLPGVAFIHMLDHGVMLRLSADARFKPQDFDTEGYIRVIELEIEEVEPEVEE